MASEVKKIIVVGKHNTECITKKDKVRRIKVNAIDQELENEDELVLINDITNNVVGSDNHRKCISAIERKINSYKHQDVKKNIYNEKLLISLSELYSKLVDSKLICYYCRDKVKLMYRIVRDPKQWTLDRVDNDLCHSNDNTVICCLSCNLKRRVIDHDKFNFTKRMVLVKKDQCGKITETI